MYLMGAVGNTIHAWSIAQKSEKTFKKINLLTIHIFSAGMDLLDEKKIPLGEWDVTNIDFQMENSFYYLNIIYTPGINKKLIYKIDAAGNLTDVTNVPGILIKPHYSSGSPSTALNSNNFFVGQISDSVADSTVFNASLPQGENFDNKQSYEKLVVRKISIGTRLVAGEKVYASGNFNFSRLVVTATDSTVYACAFAQSKNIIYKNPYKGSYLFLARLDTNLAEPAYGTILLQNEKWPADLLLIPNAVFSLNNRLIVISTVLYSKLNVAHNLNGNTYILSNVFSQYVPGSIVITQTDKNNHLLADTIIKIKKGGEQLDWGNRFILPASNQVHLFCSHRFSDSKTGIKLFTIDRYGKITEKELVVDINYSYALAQAVSLEPGVLLIPYTYKRKTGLVKLEYGNGK